MKRFASRFLADYGMLLPLIGLCVVFSVRTMSDHEPSSDVAAEQVAGEIASTMPKSASVLIAVRNQIDDVDFSKQLSERLANADVKIVDIVIGEPKNARESLVKLAASGTKLDAIAATPQSRQWIVFADLKSDFPALGEPRIVSPLLYRWPTFLLPGNLVNIAEQIAVIAIVAIGMTMVIVAGGIDLSVGSLIALSAVLVAGFIRDYAGGTQASPLGMILASAAAIGVCGLFGVVSGALITRFELPPFIVTLAVMLIASGEAFSYSEGRSISEVPESFKWLGRGANFFGLPNVVVLMLLLYGIAEIVMARMRFGRYVYAVGGNREAARLAGVPVSRVVITTYVLSGVLAGLGGVIFASIFASGLPTYGKDYEFKVIAAVVVGGTSLSGGEGKIFGTLIGAFTIAIIQNWMNLEKIEPFRQVSVLGSVILAAVLFDRVRRGRLVR
jgi:ribose transport system permease protein